MLADYWFGLNNNDVVCELCPHRCVISDNKSGLCAIRKNQNGQLIAASYGLVSGFSLDPIEKKPLYMYKPGTHILSVGSYGCNFHCGFCQNYEISLEFENRLSSAKFVSPENIVSIALETRSRGNIGVAYTYNEPLVGYEFVRDTAKLISAAGLDNVLVTNGYINEEPLRALLPYINAMNIDLKSFSNSFYRKIGGDLETVKNTIMQSREHCHVEITTLIIPDENDDSVEVLAQWVAEIDNAIPLHLSRFFPRYKSNKASPTSREMMCKLRDIASKYLINVFVGNM